MPSQRQSAISIDALIKKLPVAQQEIVESLRALVKKADPKASEGFKWSMPVFEHDGMLCYIWPLKGAVNFGFYQSAPVLDDPDGLLEGTGKRMRHVKLMNAGDIQSARFTRWVKQAAAFNHEQSAAKSSEKKPVKSPGKRTGESPAPKRAPAAKARRTAKANK